MWSPWVYPYLFLSSSLVAQQGIDPQLNRPLLAGDIDLDNHSVAVELVGQGIDHICYGGGERQAALHDIQDDVDSKDDVPPKDEQPCEGDDNVSC